MFKGNSIVLVFSVIMVLFMIVVSIESTIIRVLLIILSVVFLQPGLRKTLFTNQMFLRKIKVSLYTSLIITGGLYITKLPSILTLFPEVAATVYFSLFGILIYGLPASMIAELVSNRTPAKRVLFSGVIHIGFGLLAFFLSSFSSFGIITSVCSVIYFALDEISRKMG